MKSRAPVLRNVIIESLYVFADPLPDDPSELVARAEEDGRLPEFETSLTEFVGDAGEVMFGPRQAFEFGIRAHYFIELIREVRLEILRSEMVSVRTAEGEIFDSGYDLLHVRATEVSCLRGEVVRDLYGDFHGEVIDDLALDLYQRLEKWASDQFAAAGACPSESLVSAFVRLAHQTAPSEMTWDLLSRTVGLCLKESTKAHAPECADR